MSDLTRSEKRAQRQKERLDKNSGVSSSCPTANGDPESFQTAGSRNDDERFAERLLKADSSMVLEAAHEIGEVFQIGNHGVIFY